MLASWRRRLLPQPFPALFALRRRYLRQESQALYQRYGHALGIFGAFFALALVERPSLLAAPILQFWRDPLAWRDNLVYLVGWLTVVGLWARVHRSFVRGAGFAVFARSASHGHYLAPRLDMALLLVALQWFIVPFAIAAGVVLAAGAGTVLFWGAFLVILLLTIAAARAVVFGAGRASRLRLLAVPALLAAAPLADGWPLVACLALLARELARPAPARASTRRDDGASGRLRGPGPWFLFQLHGRALWRSHLHVALPRIGAALFLHALCWAMVHLFGKEQDAAGFVTLACCASAYLLAGLYYAFWQARQPLQPFLRSLPFGTAKTMVAEHLVVLGAGAAVFGLAWLAHAQVAGSLDVATVLLRRAGWSLMLLALLGAPILQRHQYGVAMKVALCAASLILM